MKLQWMITALLVSSVTASAQMASHAPTTQVQPTTQTATAEVSGKAVAKVNDTVLTDKDLLREMYTIFPYAKQHNGFPKGQEAQIRQGALQMIIFEELVYQEAVRRGMSVPAAKITQGASAYRSTFDTPEQFRQYIKTEMGGSEQKFRKQIERSMLIDQLLKQEIDAKSSVSLAELRSYYDKNPERFTVPESYRFQSISVVPRPPVSAQQAKDARKRADDALKQAQGAKTYQDFGLLAEKISEDDFRVNMGDHKPLSADKLPPQVIAAFKGMKAGDVSGVIQIESAYTIVRLQEHAPAHKRSFEEVKTELKTELQKDKTEKLRVSFDKRLRTGAKIQII